MRFMVLSPDAERRDGLKALLRQIDRRNGYNEAKDWRQAIRLVEQNSFDMIVVDSPKGFHRRDLRALCEAAAPSPVAVLVDDMPGAEINELFDTGVQGVVPRSMGSHLVIRAFELVVLGGFYIPPGALDLIATQYDGQRTAQIANRIPLRRRPSLGTLSPRQAQIMRFVHMGNTNKMIARTLGISEGTVKIHLASIFQQLGAANRAAAVAIYNGWLPPHLEVLASARQVYPRPVSGAPGPVPLRPRANRRKYPVIAYDGSQDPWQMAAEPMEQTLKRNT